MSAVFRFWIFDYEFRIGGIAALYLFDEHAGFLAVVAAGVIPANIDEMANGGDKPRCYY